MMLRGPVGSALTCLLPLLVAGPARADDLNQKVVDFCKKNLGKQVGDGECFALAYVALKDAGAKLDFKNDPGPGDAVWGARVYTLEARDGKQVEEAAAGKRVRPGDVIQFRDATFEGKVGDGIYSLFAPQHTAVVIEVGAGGKELTVLHQNWNGKRTVQKELFRLKDLKNGWLRIYEPLAP
jgi:hypothetical protein